MTEAWLFVGVGSLLAVGGTTQVIAVLTLRNARRYVALAEERMERLREGQEGLVLLLRERQAADHERKLHIRRDLQDRISELERELQHLRELHQETVRQESRTLLEKGLETAPGARKLRGTTTLPAERARKSAPPTGPAEFTPEDDRQRRGVWHPHPDDDVSPAQADGASSAPVEMFRRHYDKYLENYQGYVRLAERLYRMRDDAADNPGSWSELEWEEKLRRVNDGIKRTTARLDILEEYNPELATDDRISRRAGIARTHWNLERGGRHTRTS